MARGNLAAARRAAARRGKSPTSEVDVRLDLQPVGTATEGSTLVRDLTRPPAKQAVPGSARQVEQRRRPKGFPFGSQAPRLNPRPPKSNRESRETHNANEPGYAPARARTRAISSRLGPNIPGAAPPASRHKMESWPRWWML